LVKSEWLKKLTSNVFLLFRFKIFYVLLDYEAIIYHA
jgi:hypothetical protein